MRRLERRIVRNHLKSRSQGTRRVRCQYWSLFLNCIEVGLRLYIHEMAATVGAVK